jgi:Uma2 family endonuclease
MATATPRPVPDKPAPVPPLENGDHLTRAEFERRYAAMPHVKKAELIDGVVYMPSPVRHRHHGNPHFTVIVWLGLYAGRTPGVEGADNGSVRLDETSEPQPDAFLMILPEASGQARIDDDDYVAGTPELVVEVAASSVSFDLHRKLRMYQRGGAREYIVWRVEDQAIDWFVLRAGRFEPLPAAETLKSEVFPGLWLDPAALIAGDMPRVFQVLDQGLAQPEHAAFVLQLQQRRQQP